MMTSNGEKQFNGNNPSESLKEFAHWRRLTALWYLGLRCDSIVAFRERDRALREMVEAYVAVRFSKRDVVDAVIDDLVFEVMSYADMEVHWRHVTGGRVPYGDQHAAFETAWGARNYKLAEEIANGARVMTRARTTDPVVAGTSK